MIFEKIRERLNKAREEAKELQKTTTDAYGYMKMKQGLDCAIGIVDEVETEYNNGWIPCSERLPEDDSTVWVTYIDYGKELTATAYYDLESGYWYVGYFDYKTKSVTHWQPLPQPPKI